MRITTRLLAPFCASAADIRPDGVINRRGGAGRRATKSKPSGELGAFKGEEN